MNFKTKFDLGQEVFIIKDNLIYRAKIKCMSISVLESGMINIQYWFHAKEPTQVSELSVFSGEVDARLAYSQLPIADLK